MASPSEIRLPWPTRSLWPNSRVGWQALHRAKKEAKEVAWATAKGVRDLEIELYQHWEVTFLTTPHHNFDEDNALAACKAYIDGIAQACGKGDGYWSYKTRRLRWNFKGVIFRPITPEPKTPEATPDNRDARDEFLQEIKFQAIPPEGNCEWEYFCKVWGIEMLESGRRGWMESVNSYVKDARWIAVYEGMPIALVY